MATVESVRAQAIANKLAREEFEKKLNTLHCSLCELYANNYRDFIRHVAVLELQLEGLQARVGAINQSY